MNQPGYRFGMRQPAIKLRLIFALPKNISLNKLNTWICEALASDVDSYKPIFLNGKPDQTAEQKYLGCILQVATILLQDISVPVFERAAVTEIRKSPSQTNSYVADVWFPVVDDFPTEIFHTWLRLASELICNALKSGGDSKILESFYQDFQNQYVLPSLRRIPGGKSTIPLLEAAFELGIPFAHLGLGKYVLGWGNQSKIFDKSSSNLDSAFGAGTTHNKDIALKIMRRSGIPVPKGLTFLQGKTVDSASIAHLRPPLVVKPVDRDRGEGVTMGLISHQSIQAAAEKAGKLSRAILIEEQIEGTCHRVLVVSGRVIYAVRRNPRGVTGDGIHTIEQLVEIENASIRRKIPQKRIPELLLDQEALDFLETMGLYKESVLGNRQRIHVRPAQSTQWGGCPEDLTAKLHPENAELCIRVAKLFSLECAGVDFISTDVSTPWYENNAVINEVNFKPTIGRTHSYQRHAARSYLEQLFPLNGKIPIDVYVGESSKKHAIDKWQQDVLKGKSSYFCSDENLFKPSGRVLQLAGAQSIFDKVMTLRTNISVEALVVHANDENLFREFGYPFDYHFLHKN